MDHRHSVHGTFALGFEPLKPWLNHSFTMHPGCKWQESRDLGARNRVERILWPEGAGNGEHATREPEGSLSIPLCIHHQS